MKRDFLKNLDLGEGSRIPDAVIDSIMAEHGKTVNQRDQTISTLQGQLQEANGKLTGYDPKWKEKADEATRQLERQQFDFALERGMAAAKPRNAKAVAALLDREKLKLAGGELVGLDQQLEAMKKDDATAFLFEQEPQRKTGMSHQNAGSGGENKNAAANDALRAIFKGGKV